MVDPHAGRPSADAGQVQQGEPKAYPEDADGDNDEAYAAQDRPER